MECTKRQDGGLSVFMLISSFNASFKKYEFHLVMLNVHLAIKWLSERIAHLLSALPNRRKKV